MDNGCIRATMLVSPKKLTWALTAIVLGLLLAHITTQCMKYFLGHDIQLGLLRLFDLDQEGTLPSWYSSSTLLLCSLFLLVIGLAKKHGGDRYGSHWLVLSIIFFCLSIDEAASLHEMSTIPLRTAFDTTGYLDDAWVIGGGTFALAVFVALLRFLAALPGRTRNLFMMAGVLYVGGAVGMEIFGSNYNVLYGRQTLAYSLMATAEEGLEMFGIVVFLYALSSYMASHVNRVVIWVSDTIPDSAALPTPSRPQAPLKQRIVY